MALEVERAAGIGFCFGVRRAIDMLEKAAIDYGGVETLGPVVHNQQVMKKLASKGITVVDNVADIKGGVVAIGAHGVGPRLEAELRKNFAVLVDTTCPFVKRAQVAARRLARSGFFVVIYGDAGHREVKGILEWTGGRGLATLEDGAIVSLAPTPRRLGVLSQTTQIPASFTRFVKRLVDTAFNRDTELRIIDTICHDIRQRQQAALELASRVDLMLVIGSRTSANTNHLARWCATVAPTYLVEAADEIETGWLKGRRRIGITGGASTDEDTIAEVLSRLKAMVL